MIAMAERRLVRQSIFVIPSSFDIRLPRRSPAKAGALSF
jgi:hypothetical protein